MAGVTVGEARGSLESSSSDNGGFAGVAITSLMLTFDGLPGLRFGVLAAGLTVWKLATCAAVFGGRPRGRPAPVFGPFNAASTDAFFGGRPGPRLGAFTFLLTFCNATTDETVFGGRPRLRSTPGFERAIVGTVVVVFEGGPGLRF